MQPKGVCADPGAMLARQRAQTPCRLNLGAGAVELPGYESVDIKTGTNAGQLPHLANSVDEIVASHVLEHFSHRETQGVLKEWWRVLRPGGLLRVAVPNIDWIVDAYKSEESGQAPVELYLMGGHVDEHDVHKAIFNEQKLRILLSMAGFTDIKPWTVQLPGCCALPVSLNLEATKAEPIAAGKMPDGRVSVRVAAVMTAPRLCFIDMMFAAIQAFAPLGIPIERAHGAFWGQCLTNVLERAIENGAELVFTLDYDTVFSRTDVEYMIMAMVEHPEFDALSSVQIKRGCDSALFTMVKEDGSLRETVPVMDIISQEFSRIASSHFGLTVFRTAAFADLAKPWFLGEPGPDGRWKEGRKDEDIAFWHGWRKAGKTLHQANRVRVGHLQLMVTWPDATMHARHQYVEEYTKTGIPEDLRR
ncbi:MAG TPA: methyltransferase domain-containing protein [Vicinamibacterales bacterium]|nr:methyltransferase domain-containing protein [Vicinamibacterales bacterium]